jgi:hypothetical protein
MAHTLVGKFFHTYHDGVLENQGQILSHLGDELYLVQLYEWLFGAPSEQRLEPLTNMKEWKIYDTAEEMRYAYDRYCQQHPHPVSPR